MIRIIKRYKHKNIFYDEEGFSTLTVVVSLLLCLTLVFSSAQVYRINSSSADIQNVSDACAQSAQNEVGEFMLAVRLVDSTILSLSLASLVSAGLGVVCMCTPVTAAISDKLIECAKMLLNARNSFAEKSAKSLNAIQKSLPFLSSVKAYQLAKSNNGGVFSADYLALTVLMPGEGLEIKPGNTGEIQNAYKGIDEQALEIKKAAAEAEEAAKKAMESKQKAFMADCGNNPNYCMYERAKTKAKMDGAINPLYNSVDTWSFSVALNRSKAYYPTRLNIEKPEGSSVNEQANSQLRKLFYQYATKQMQYAYVNENEDLFDANFPHLPKNTEEMRTTTLYTDPVFPVSNDSGNFCMHAYDGCPGCSSVAFRSSIRDMESQSWKECNYCRFLASSMGSVAAASTSIDNGFEYHYAVVEQEAKKYKEAKDKAAPLNAKVKNFANGIFSKLKDLINEVANKRLEAKPPGSYGALCITVNKSEAPASSGFESSFVSSNARLGVRAAISACTLVEEESNESSTIITSFADEIANKMPSVSGPVGIVLGAWSKLLVAYNSGIDAFSSAIEDSLNQIPLMSVSGLGTWASKKFKEIINTCGLAPAKVQALKPVLINSYYVSSKEKDDQPTSLQGKAAKSFAIKYMTIKNEALKIDNATNSLLGGISSKEEFAKMLHVEDLIDPSGKIEIATIEPLGDWGPSIPITISLPGFATDTMSNTVSGLAGAIQSVLNSVWGGKVWR